MSEDAPFETCDTTCGQVKKLYKWTKEEKTGFRKLAHWCKENWPSLFHAFVNTTKSLNAKGVEIGYDWNQLLVFERDLAAICIGGNMLEAAVKMADHLVFNVETYLGGSNDPEYQKLLTELSGYRQQLAASGSA